MQAPGTADLHRTICRIKELGKKAGVVINPATPAGVLEEILPDLDLVVVMTVNPGFGHQHFLPVTLQKTERVRRMIEHLNIYCEVEVDGGIDQKTAPLAAAAGADVFVAGSSVFGADVGVPGAIDRLRFAVLPDLARIAQDYGESGNRRPASDRTEQAQCLAGSREESGRDQRE